MTDEELIALLHSDTPLSRARKEFYNWCAKIDQRQGLSPIEMRKMEFEAVNAIIAAFAREDGE